MDRRAYWLWLQHAFPAGSSKPKSIFNRYNNLKEFYEGGPSKWASLSFLTDNDLTLLASYNINQAKATLEYCENMDMRVICPECAEYPEALWNIKDPPAVLYVRGEMPDFDANLSIAVVGSRKTSELSLKTAEEICYNLSKEEVIIVSGGAVGIDTAAHKGALMGIAPTVAVLGCGLEFPYLLENELLRQKIVSKGGALITEYPPSMGVTKGTFQARNRIISGLANGTLIVSAEKKSGTMITARRAIEQNKDLFAVPGNPALPTSEGPNSLIKDGATPVTSYMDIMEYYACVKTKDIENKEETVQLLLDELIEPKAENNENTLGSSDYKDKIISQFGLAGAAKVLVEALEFEPLHISRISEKTALSAQEILSVATELELLDIIVAYSGQRYALNNNIIL